MNTQFFKLDDVSSELFGIHMSGAPVFDAPRPKLTKVDVAGRNGSLFFEEEAYENVKGTIKAFLLTDVIREKTVYELLAEANTWLLKGGYRKLSYDGDNGAYRMAMVVNGAECAVRMKHLAPFSIEFDCKPQHFWESGDEDQTFSANGTLTNPWTGGLPLITVYGTSGTISVNGYDVVLDSIDEYVVLDCDTQNAYKGTLNCNADISCDEFPRLKNGTNAVTMTSGIASVVIKPRWFSL